jgi:TolB-like protein/Tfp pilus assembly protein PilF
VPDALARLILRCLEKRPDDRVQTARDVYNELRHVQKQLESGAGRRPPASSGLATPASESLWIAVLPFTTRGADSDGTTLAAGLTEDITTGLSKFPGLSVVALQSARSFKDSPLDVRQIAERLNARYVMGGSVRKSASAVRVAAHVIDAHSSAQLWAETYDRRPDDIFAVQDDVTDRVVSTIADKAGVLARSMMQACRHMPLDRLSAQQLVHRCWGHEARPSPAEHADLRAAVEVLLARQPGVPELHVELASLYIAEHCLLYNQRPDPIGRGLRAARRAIELDRSNQRGWVQLAIGCFFNYDDAGFLEAADQALRLNPRDSNAIAWIGTMFAQKGDYDRGCAHVERAMALNSAHPGWYHFTHFNRHFARREFAEALRAARRVNVADFMWMHLAIAAAAGHLGLAEEGRAAAETLAALAPPLADDANLREFLTRWYWDAGVVESFLEGVRRSRGSTATPPAAPMSNARRGPAHEVERRAQPALVSTGIAVIPFVAAGDEESSALAEGLTEDITSGLARFPYLSVVTADSARQHKASSTDVREIGHALGARYVLGGSLRRAGTAIRIAVRLADAESGAQLWSETYTRDLQQHTPISVQDDVTDRAVATVADVQGVLLRTMSKAVSGRPIDELDPAELRLRYWSYHRQHAPAEHGLLRDTFERFAERQPAFAPVWAGLAHLYLHEYGFGFNPRPDPLERARHAVSRALELDGINQHAWEALAVSHFFAHDRDAFVDAVERMLALNPRNASAMAHAGILFVHMGDLDRGCALADRAMALNPDHPGWYHIAHASREYAMGNFEAALRSAKRINLPQHLWAQALVAISAAQLGRAAEAAAALDALLTLEPSFVSEPAIEEAVSRWKWVDGEAEGFLDGFRKARALRDAPRHEARANRPSSGSSLSYAPPVVGARDSDAGRVADAFVVTVLPFTSPGAGTDAEGLAEGLAQGIAVGLSRFSYLRVVKRSATADVTTGYVLQGSVRSAGGIVRVVAQLTEAASGASVWAETFDRDAARASLFQQQDELTETIVSTIADANGALVRSMATTVRGNAPATLTPYEAVLRRLAYINLLSPEEHAAVRDALEQTVARAPSYADAWASLAHMYVEEYTQSFNARPEPLERARAAVHRALALQSSNQLAYLVQALIGYFSRDQGAFRAAADRAIALNPLDTYTISLLGSLTAYSGKWEAGLAMCERARRLNPHHPGIYWMSSVMDRYRRRDYPGALEILDRVNMPGYPQAVIARAGIYAQLGRLDEAADLWRGAEARIPGYSARLHDEISKWFDAEVVGQIEEAADKIRAHMAARARPVSGAQPPRSIAVLPFADISPERDQAWFCDGIAEEILNALTQLPGLHVAARTSAFSFRGKDDDLKTIAEKLGVATVLQGSVRRAGDRVRVTVQLVDVSNGFQLWSERYDRGLKDIFDVQDEIARAIAARLRVTLAGGVDDRLVPKVTANLEAYDLLLKGRVLQTRRGRALLEARGCFERAVALDPDLAEAHALLGDACRLLALYGIAPPGEMTPRARASAERALELNPNQVEALAALANMKATHEWDLPAAFAISERALACDPMHVQTLAERAAMLILIANVPVELQDRFQGDILRARRLDPLNPWVMAVHSLTLTVWKRHDEAVDLARRALAIDAENFSAHWTLVVALSAAAQYDEALVRADAGLMMSGRHPRILTEVAQIHAACGRVDGAEAVYRELRGRAETTYVPWCEQGVAAASAGHVDESRDLMAKALAARDRYISFWQLPAWSRFREDADSLAMIRSIGLLRTLHLSDGQLSVR